MGRLVVGGCGFGVPCGNDVVDTPTDFEKSGETDMISEVDASMLGDRSWFSAGLVFPFLEPLEATLVAWGYHARPKQQLKIAT